MRKPTTCPERHICVLLPIFVDPTGFYAGGEESVALWWNFSTQRFRHRHPGSPTGRDRQEDWCNKTQIRNSL